MRGFTLIELLITMAIIGILLSIALPQYSAYRRRAFDVRAESDLRNAALAEEAYYFDHERYLSCQDKACTALPGLVTLSRGVQLSISATASGFAGTARHPQGSGKTFQWRSEGGGMQ